MPISSIQATIAKLSIRPPGAADAAVEETEQGGALVYACPAVEPRPPSSFSPPLSSPQSAPTSPANGLAASPPCCTPPPAAAPPLAAPAPSSLELLATLTPEAFSMEGGGKGKQRVTKQNFLQLAEGQGLWGRGEDGDDPLSSLDPLWSLGKD